MPYIRQTPAFLNPSPPLREALASVPGYRAHQKTAAALKAAFTIATAKQSGNEAEAASIVDDLAAAVLDAAPTDILGLIESRSEAARTAADNQRLGEHTLALIDAIEERVGVAIDGILRSAADRLLSHLNNSIQDEYQKTRDLDLDGINDAEHAIEEGLAEEWSAMIQSRTTIFQIRDAQTTITLRLAGREELHETLKTFGLLRNYADLYPGWLARKRGLAWGREDLTPPWPTDSAGGTDPIEIHAWIMSNPEADPWVPTITQLQSAYSTAHAAANEAMAQANQ